MASDAPRWATPTYRVYGLLAFIAVPAMSIAIILDPETTLIGSVAAAVVSTAIGGAMWAATTVVVRSTSLARASASKTLFYQLAVSAVVLIALAALLGQMSFAQVTPIALASLAYQSVIVALKMGPISRCWRTSA